MAFIGDVHGRSDKLAQALDWARRNDRETILLGDYVNRGPDARGTLELLVAARREFGDRLVLLRGNHDQAFLDALSGGPLGPFLAMGGIATVRSYAPHVQGCVGAALRQAVPPTHVALLQSLGDAWHRGEIWASHELRGTPPPAAGVMLKVVGHYVQRDLTPRIDGDTAFIDTGCGTLPEGRLTALLMPEREFVSW